MKSLLFISVVFIFCLFVGANQVQAQCASGTVYQTSLVWQEGNGVFGYSGTELDYCAGLYSNPAAWGRFTEGNYATETVRLIGEGYTEGYADWNPAQIFFSYQYPINNEYYNVDTTHYLIEYYQVYSCFYNCGYYWYDPWGLGYTGFAGVDNSWDWWDSFYSYPGSYTYYWVSNPVVTGHTFDTIIYQGTSQCPTGMQFTPTGRSCNTTPTPTPTPTESFTIKIKDKNGNDITNTERIAMLGAQTKLDAVIEPNNSNAAYSWALGNKGESPDSNKSIVYGTWIEEGTYSISVTVVSNNVSKTENVNIKVVLPEFEKIEAYETVPAIVGTECGYSGIFLGLGCKGKFATTGEIQHEGIEITTSVKPPTNHISSPTAINGPFVGFVQIVNTYAKKIETQFGTDKEFCKTKRTSPNDTSQGWLLDDQIPYGGENPITIRENLATIANFANGNAVARANDFPRDPLLPELSNALLNELFRDDDFETYTLYFFKTKDGTRVDQILGKLAWNWQGKAVYSPITGNFSLVGSLSLPSSPLTPQSLKGSAIATMREYAGIVQNLNYISCSTSGVSQFDSKFISQTIPTDLTPFQEFDGTIIMQNTGTSTWTPDNVILDVKFGNQTYGLFVSGNITPGNNAVFNLYEMAPGAGTYNFQAQMKTYPERVAFGEMTPALSIEVRSLTSCNLKPTSYCSGFMDINCQCDGWDYGNGY
ncbi:MAG: hypothetical protein ACR2J3_07030 [Aridibacter sp.]